jgi:hypothetical protein
LRWVLDQSIDALLKIEARDLHRIHRGANHRELLGSFGPNTRIGAQRQCLFVCGVRSYDLPQFDQSIAEVGENLSSPPPPAILD